MMKSERPCSEFSYSHDSITPSDYRQELANIHNLVDHPDTAQLSVVVTRITKNGEFENTGYIMGADRGNDSVQAHRLSVVSEQHLIEEMFVDTVENTLIEVYQHTDTNIEFGFSLDLEDEPFGFVKDSK